MKNKMFKILCMAICVAITFALFTGCGKKEPAASDNNTDAAENVTEAVTEAAKEQVPVLDSIRIIWSGKTTDYTKEKNISVNEFGELTEFKDNYDTVQIEYSAEHIVKKVTITDSNGEVGYEAWTYNGLMPISGDYQPNNYRSAKLYDIATITDENNHVLELTEDIEFTDSEDGSISYGINRYVYTYDENDTISSFEYYSDGELDHVTKLTYDEYGNITVYSNVGAESGSEYLRVEFSYVMVDADTVTPVEKDSFNLVYDWEKLINHIL